MNIETAKEVFTLVVNYDQTLKKMIEAGKYDLVNRCITEENFPLSNELAGKKTSVSAKLFHFDRSISSEDAISEMDRAGYRPATLAELLALGEAQPELQRQFPIIALGSVWRDAYGDRDVPELSVDGYERRLFLDWFDRDWDARCRFFAVRK
ncbi:MAG: hypothetical protein NUV82_01420 [Candidatus Komeilibacteria bacterium]|nr:hypothetical protein [Candidatus Komeilibacteria bacterium]